jgi:hypothetical protein
MLRRQRNRCSSHSFWPVIVVGLFAKRDTSSSGTKPSHGTTVGQIARDQLSNVWIGPPEVLDKTAPAAVTERKAVSFG